MPVRSVDARQILDSALFARGVELRPTVEADSTEALLAIVATGRWASIVPETTALTAVLGTPGSSNPASGIRLFALTSPSVTMPLAFVRLNTSPASAVVAALETAARLAA